MKKLTATRRAATTEPGAGKTSATPGSMARGPELPPPGTRGRRGRRSRGPAAEGGAGASLRRRGSIARTTRRTIVTAARMIQPTGTFSRTTVASTRSPALTSNSFDDGLLQGDDVAVLVDLLGDPERVTSGRDVGKSPGGGHRARDRGPGPTLDPLQLGEDRKRDRNAGIAVAGLAVDRHGHLSRAVGGRVPDGAGQPHGDAAVERERRHGHEEQRSDESPGRREGHVRDRQPAPASLSTASLDGRLLRDARTDLEQTPLSAADRPAPEGAHGRLGRATSCTTARRRVSFTDDLHSTEGGRREGALSARCRWSTSPRQHG